MPKRTATTRQVALVAVLAFTISSNVEPLVGELGDGTAHHESAAAAQRTAAPSEPGHEDGSGKSSQHQHGSQHQHRIGTDHCTHAHGLALPAALAAAFPPVVVNLENIDTITHSVRYRRHHSPPPKA